MSELLRGQGQKQLPIWFFFNAESSKEDDLK